MATTRLEARVDADVLPVIRRAAEIQAARYWTLSFPPRATPRNAPLPMPK